MLYFPGGAVYSPAITDFTFMVKVCSTYKFLVCLRNGYQSKYNFWKHRVNLSSQICSTYNLYVQLIIYKVSLVLYEILRQFVSIAVVNLRGVF